MNKMPYARKDASHAAPSISEQIAVLELKLLALDGLEDREAVQRANSLRWKIAQLQARANHLRNWPAVAKSASTIN